VVSIDGRRLSGQADQGLDLARLAQRVRRKLDLAVSLIGEPSILFLDEPTTGLDPAGRGAVWDIIRTLVAQGTTVLLTTQYLDEADALADQVTFIDAGRVIARGTPAELKARVGQTQLRVTLSSAADAAALLAALGKSAATADDVVVQIPLTSGGNDGFGTLGKVVIAIDRASIPILSYEVHEPRLDDVYFQLTGHRKSDEQVEEIGTKEKVAKKKENTR
jgi:ABC-type multidrug transport system ATPase subunit